MSVVVLPDRISESIVSQSWDNFQLDRVYIIGCVDDSIPASTILNPLAASGLPAMGESHPNVSFARVTSRRVEPLSNTEFRVICSYTFKGVQGEPGQLLKLETGARLVQKTTSFDKSKHKLRVSYNYTGKDAAVIKDSKVAVSSKMVPMATIRAQRFMTSTPRGEAMTYVGACNDDTWMDGAHHTWMCTSINGVLTQVTGPTRYYLVDYEFTYNPFTWYEPIVYFNRLGKIPADVPDLADPLVPLADSGSGLAVYQLYDEMAFDTVFSWLTD